MSAESGNLITLVDDAGEEFTLELIDYMDYNAKTYAAFLPTDIDEDDPDFGFIILQVNQDEDGFEIYDSVDDEAELDDVFEHFMTILYDEEEEQE